MTKSRHRPHVAHNSGNNEWYTPREYIEAARKVLGKIDLDPASSPQADAVVRAAVHYAIDDSGLAHEWRGRVWLNPPYAAELVGRFIVKLAIHVDAGDVSAAIVLVNNATETAWFQSLLTRASALVFPRGRVRFLRPDGTPGMPLQGQAIVYVGTRPSVFLKAFEKFGRGMIVPVDARRRRRRRVGAALAPHGIPKRMRSPMR